MPILRRGPIRPRSERPVMSSPSTTMRPAVARSSPLIRRISVDLPAPDRPMMPNTSPRPDGKRNPVECVNGSACATAREGFRDLSKGDDRLGHVRRASCGQLFCSYGGVHGSATINLGGEGRGRSLLENQDRPEFRRVTRSLRSGRQPEPEAHDPLSDHSECRSRQANVRRWLTYSSAAWRMPGMRNKAWKGAMSRRCSSA